MDGQKKKSVPQQRLNHRIRILGWVVLATTKRNRNLRHGEEPRLPNAKLRQYDSSVVERISVLALLFGSSLSRSSHLTFFDL